MTAFNGDTTNVHVPGDIVYAELSDETPIFIVLAVSGVECTVNRFDVYVMGRNGDGAGFGWSFKAVSERCT